MEFEAEEPIYRCFAPCCQVVEHLMLSNASIVTNLETGGVNKTDTATLAKAMPQIGTQW
jgi:hypothetical protein